MKKLATPRTLPRLALSIALVAFIAGVWSQRTAAQAPTPTFTVSGVVKDSTGPALANVTVILLSDATGTQITFTDQNGNYVFNHPSGVSHSLRVMASKSGYVFDPLAVIFISSIPLTDAHTVSFVGTKIPIVLPFQMPVLLTQENSLRSLALESVTFMAEPFTVTAPHPLSPDQRTRISLFAVNVELEPFETASVITAQAEDSVGQIFPLTVEYFGAVPNFGWLKQIVVKLPDAIANSNEVRVSLNVRGTAGNKVIIKIKP